ncbi:hypothetical protein CYMTET_52757 [Cymbomonas tetramitiformis]|uniref:F-box domain-containing protein n=1 Tax=Cymbomonas tetramitiformis TaxID=36881 RepID=A0AAE0BJJ2_9CHLO|nr:hypothetical protein CYMTET_52757 [Cymbomonas tetramitiformis]
MKLFDLPPYILCDVFLFSCTARDLAHVRLTCRRARELACTAEDDFWAQLFQNAFGARSQYWSFLEQPDIPWQARYRERVLAARNWKFGYCKVTREEFVAKELQEISEGIKTTALYLDGNMLVLGQTTVRVAPPCSSTRLSSLGYTCPRMTLAGFMGYTCPVMTLAGFRGYTCPL